MSDPLSWRAGSSAWPRLQPRCNAERPRPKRQPRRSASSEPQPKRSANGQARHAEARRPSLWKRPRRTKRSPIAPTPSCLSCQPRTKVGSTVARACQSILACDVTDAANDTQQAVPVAHATLTTLAQAGIEPPRTRQARPTPSRRLWITAMTVRQPPRHWRTEGLIPPGPRGARSTRPLRPRRATRLPRRRSGGPRKCGRLQARHSTPDARSSWNRCVVRAKKSVGSVASCCVVWRRSGANGGWYA